jgi:hypothetical protein
MSVAVDDPIPLELRANDVVSHAVNIDSEFRDGGCGSDSGDFQFTLLTPVRNVLRVRLASVELPAESIPVWSAARANTRLRIYYRDLSATLMSVDVYVEDAVSYSPAGLAAALDGAIAAAALPFAIGVSWDDTARRFVFTGTATNRFGVDARTAGCLASYMGFSRKLHAASVSGSGSDSGLYTLTSDRCVDVDLTVDRYYFLRVGDFAGVRQTTGDSEFVALAKIVWVGAEKQWQWSGGTVVFPAPRDVARFQVQLLDRYGGVVGLCGLPLSLSLEVLEVRNSSMYNTVRDGLAVVWS